MQILKISGFHIKSRFWLLLKTEDLATQVLCSWKKTISWSKLMAALKTRTCSSVPQSPLCPIVLQLSHVTSFYFLLGLCRHSNLWPVSQLSGPQVFLSVSRSFLMILGCRGFASCPSDLPCPWGVISNVSDILLFFFNLFFWLCWVFVSVRGLSLVAASGGHSSSRCGDLSLSRPLLLRSTGSRRAGSVVVAHGLSCSAACGIFPDQGSNPCSLHWQADSQPLRHRGSPDILLLM